MKLKILQILLLMAFSYLSTISNAAEIKMSRTDLLLGADFENEEIDGWELSGKGASRVTEYSGNHSLNLTRTRTAQISVAVEEFNRIDITMQLAAMGLAKGESCVAEISTNEGQRWQALLTVTPEMADGVTLHTQSGQLKNSGSIKNLMLRYRANGGRKTSCWGDNVQVVGKKNK
jgi:hypothetical protein